MSVGLAHPSRVVLIFNFYCSDLPGAKMLQSAWPAGQVCGLPRRRHFRFKTDSVDCLPLINRQLDGILVLIRGLSTCDTDESKFRLFCNICNRAVLHVLSRECLLLPAWRRARWKEFPLASFQAHVRFKRALAELVVCPPSAEGHDAAVEVFADQVTRQRILDSEFLVPMLRGAMDVQQVRDLCNDMERLFEADRTDDELSLSINTSPHDLVNEAELVLSSLAPHREHKRNSSGCPMPSPKLGVQ